jgi:polysaccharide export outer membrane protein
MPGGRAAAYALLAAAGSLALAGCAEFPEGGPSAKTVIGQAKTKHQYSYAVVRVTSTVLHDIDTAPRGVMAAAFADSAPAPAQLIGIGDQISITTWDFGGLLSTPSGQAPPATAPMAAPSTPTTPPATAATIPAQTVDENGNITVPYAGTVHAAGLSSTQLQQSVAVALAPVMVHPQVLVSVVTNQSSFVTVVGDINHPGRVSLTLAGLRLLDAIALSGGTIAPASDMLVHLTRHGVTRIARMIDVLHSPGENIYLRNDDVVTLDREPQSVVVLGATNHNAQIPFGKGTFTLAEALGNGGGLADIQSDPAGVFVFRYETPEIARAVGWGGLAPSGPAGLVPVVYQIDLKTPDGLFMALAFPMHDRDVVYVANSDTVQINKIFRFLIAGSSIFKTSSTVTN